MPSSVKIKNPLSARSIATLIEIPLQKTLLLLCNKDDQKSFAASIFQQKRIHFEKRLFKMDSSSTDLSLIFIKK
ncbi:hypothetical protein [Lysinibacillus xylanilyticus]